MYGDDNLLGSCNKIAIKSSFTFSFGGWLLLICSTAITRPLDGYNWWLVIGNIRREAAAAPFDGATGY